jgi:mRNA interferase MazF
MPSPTQSQSPGTVPRRGEIWWVALDPTLGSEIAKTRPCIVVGHNAVNEHRRTIVVVPLSSAARAYPPIGIPISCQGRPSVAVTDQIRAVTKERFREKIGAATQPEISAIGAALREVLVLD